MCAKVDCEPTTKTIKHENTSTTIVRSAVARSESVFLIPHLASIEVSPAKAAESMAAIIQSISFLRSLYDNFSLSLVDSVISIPILLHYTTFSEIIKQKK